MNSKTGQDIISNVSESTGIAAQNVSDFATNLVAKFEQFSATPYKDIAGYLTWGYGHKAQPGETVPMQLTKEQGKELLAQDMQQAAYVVDKNVTVPLTENQRAALISFVFNTASNDENRFVSSHLLSKLNSGDYQGAADEMKKWVYAGGSISNGLIARRDQERDLFLT